MRHKTWTFGLCGFQAGMGCLMNPFWEVNPADFWEGLGRHLVTTGGYTNPYGGTD